MATLLIRAQLVSFVSQQCSIRSQRSVKRYYSHSIINSCHVDVQYIIVEINSYAVPIQLSLVYILELNLYLGGNPEAWHGYSSMLKPWNWVSSHTLQYHAPPELLEVQSCIQ